MARLVVMYRTPADAGAFDRHYRETHIPLAKNLPGLRSYEISTGPVLAPGGASDYHLVAVLGFDDIGALQAALGSPEGAAAVADLEIFATAGVEILMFDDAPA
ncbi:EthD family reductase [Cereibacter changlensis]|jgi:uncharacterized protein (TIGR02118 family)|uniref:EthD family reductase n=1 Tax=Cereibacter changlensis TaxID=402884 RepID=A0A4U0YZH5_9RHOB|nr:EthD family reductase [Cereibacter changlensis]MBZ4691353.1 hypothetical protein [Cereibacter sp.]TKA98312.1 EthD family reductase [Cereibacter changlensis]